MTTQTEAYSRECATYLSFVMKAQQQPLLLAAGDVGDNMKKV